MSEEQEDIRDIAERAVKDACFWTPKYKAKVIEAVSAAILAERERCAEVADSVSASAIKFMQERLNQHSNDFQRFSEGCTAVAVSIRRGDQPTPSKARQTEEDRS